MAVPLPRPIYAGIGSTVGAHVGEGMIAATTQSLAQGIFNFSGLLWLPLSAGAYYEFIVPNGVDFTIGFRATIASNAISNSGTLVDFMTAAAASVFNVNIAGALDSGLLQLRRGTNVLASSTTAISRTTPHYFEIKLKADGSVGTIHLDVDGSQEVGLTGQNTENNSGGIERVRIYGITTGTAPTTFYNSGYIIAASGAAAGWGPIIYEDHVPDGDLAPEQWSLSAGSDSFALIDEAQQDANSTYIHTDTSGNRTRVSLADRVETGATKCLWGYATCTKPDSGSSEVQINIDSNGTVDSSDPLTPGDAGTYQTVAWPWEEDPDTTAPWSNAGVDAIEIEVEHV